MYYQVKAGLVYAFMGIGIIILICSGIAGYSHFQMQQELEAAAIDKAAMEQQLKEYKHNKESIVKDEAAAFLKAFLESDPSEFFSTEDRIKPYTTERARQQVIIPGEGEGQTTVKISSKLADMKLYYTPIDSNKASVLGSVTREISVNKTATSSKQMIELQLILIKGKWIVDDIKLIGQ